MSFNKNDVKSVEELEKIIKEQEIVIAEMKRQMSAKDYQLDKLNSEYQQLNTQYFAVLGSFFWRATAPLRKVSQAIKNILTKNKGLLKFAIYIKGFLRGGFKGGKKQLENYLTKIEEENLGPMEISNFVRKKQERFQFSKNIKFSILVPLYNTPKDFLIEMINSVREQTYSNWELCLADGSTADFAYVEQICKDFAKKDKRIVYKKLENNLGISDNTNACLEMASGDYIGLFDHDDLLHPSALFEYATVINEKNADFIYCDEVTFSVEDGELKFLLKHHKSAFAPDTLRSYNYICHFTCFSRKLYEQVGGFNKEFEGSQDYDMILRLTEKANNIVRVPKILYFWRSHKNSVASGSEAKPYVVDSAKRALAAHMNRLGLSGDISEATVPTTYKIDYEITGEPKVSIIIPNKDHIDDLDMCINSVISKSTYKNFEIIIIENNSTQESTFEYYEQIQKKHDNIKVVYWKEKVFNYSAINNFGEKYASGEYVLLLNNDIEVLTPNWIEEMLMFAQRADVGAVGAKLYYPDNTIQHAGVIIGLGGVAGHSHKYYNREDPGYMARASISQNLSACTAACLLIRKDVFEQVDGLDEGFAVAFNDIDLCMKIRNAGYLIVFTPYAEFYHYESKSRGFEDSPEKIARFNSEIKRFTNKWGEELEQGDPYYNPNLTLEREDFSLK